MQTDVILRNHVSVTGRGTQPILFAHGFGCNQGMWNLVAPAFEDAFKVVLFDYVGFGTSDVSSFDLLKYSTLDGYAQDILDVCHALNLEDVIFVGHSVSSMIGVLAAKHDPAMFSRFVMIGPSPCYINEGEYAGGFERQDIEGLLDLMDRNYIGWAQALAGIVMKNPDRPELAEDLTEIFCSTDPVVARTFAEATFYADNRNDLENFSIPTLVLQCSDDSIAPDFVGRYVAEHIASGTLLKLDATGHCPQLSHPTEVIHVIRDFVEG